MSEYADLIIMNANVYTVDDQNPWADAAAVKGNKIVYVGDNDGAMLWQGPQTRLIDGDGRTLLPGFIDSHFHLMHGALGMGDIQLYEVSTLAELEAAVHAFALDNPDLPWLRGQGLRYGIPSTDEPLGRRHLDAIEAQRPLVLIAYDVHTAWANTAALEKAGLLHGAAPRPEGTSLSGGARIVMGSDGLATGELFEMAAFEKLLDHIPEPDDAQRRRLVRNALTYLASLGVTSVHNMDGDAEQASFYAALEDLGELTLRVYVPYSVLPETPLEALEREAAPMREQFQSDMVRAGSVKFFMDGVYESYTAVTLNGYPDQPDNHGQAIFDRDHFARMTAEADRLGLQIFTHACGDGAVRRVLDGYQTARESNGRRDSRHRVEHIEMIDLNDAPRFAQLDVIASMQPLHSPLQANDPDVWTKRVPEEDWDRAFAWRTMREARAHVAFGSDWPVAPPDPIWGIAAAVNRRPWKPGHDSHNQSLEEAIAGYTRDAAYAEFQEDKKGQIKVGMLADMVLLNEDLFSMPVEDLANARVAMTICDGRVVFER